MCFSLVCFLLAADNKLKLKDGFFEEMKPGLSSYVDEPKKGAETLHDLLAVAKKFIPESEWKSTPISLKATAGLRLLPKEKAEAILKAVREQIIIQN